MPHNPNGIESSERAVCPPPHGDIEVQWSGGKEAKIKLPERGCACEAGNSQFFLTCVAQESLRESEKLAAAFAFVAPGKSQRNAESGKLAKICRAALERRIP